MTPKSFRRFFFLAAILSVAAGCAHTGPDPFVYRTLQATDTGDALDPCFTGPLADCVELAPRTGDTALSPSPWRYPFQPDLNARICRGDETARRRILDGVQQIDGGRTDRLAGIYLGFLDDCSSGEFCSWAVDIAADTKEEPNTRDVFLEAARRSCPEAVAEERLQLIGNDLGRNLAEEPPWRTSTQAAQLAVTPRSEQPWEDLEGLFRAGCLDLANWMDRHRDNADETAAALERCAGGREIRYREADCLRELAGLDRERAVAFLQDESRTGWGMSSTINRYAKTILRFPEDGQLESELATLDLLPAIQPTRTDGDTAAILPSEILEQNQRLLRFNPSCSVRYCEHALLMYDLVGLVSPALDDLVITERWPALESVPTGSGPRSVSYRIRGVSAQFSVAEDDNGDIDREQLDQLKDAAKKALTQPHEIVIHGKAGNHHLQLRNLVEYYDLETLIGALNTILANRKSELRFVALAPHCIPCAQILAGPREGLVGASLAGLIEVVDPFNELWTQPDFDSTVVAAARSSQ